MGKAALAGISSAATAAGTALTKIGKDAVMAYADFEQLVGGVETLFGAQGQSLEEYAKSAGKAADEVKGEWENLQTAQDMVLNNAANAWQAVGMSANEYMEIATSSAASMISSLGGDTVEAARLTNMAVTDMADNANKMGSSMESIQNAYAGFAKGNFTMLDNLKLGYGGTKEEMARLLEDAQKLSGVKYDISSYSDIAQAIHVISVEMGIAGITMEEYTELVESGKMTQEEAFALLGTTAKEANFTISGSFNAMKAAWSNLMTGMADENADMGALVDNMANSIQTFANNIVPRIIQTIPQIVKGISQLAKKMAPMATEIISSLVNAMVKELPGMVKAGGEIIRTLADAIIKQLPELLSAAEEILAMLMEGLTEALPQLVDIAMDIIMMLAMGIIEALPQILQSALNIVLMLAQGIIEALPQLIPAIISLVQNIATFIVENVNLLIDTGFEVIMQLAQGIIEAIPELVPAVLDIINGILDFLLANMPILIAAGIEIMLTLAQAIIENLPAILEAVVKMLVLMGETLIAQKGLLLAAIVSIVTALAEWLGQQWVIIKNKVPELMQQLKEKLSGQVQKFKDVGKNIVEGLKNGISDAWDGLKKWFSDKITGLLESAKSLLKIESPSKEFAYIGRMCVAGWEQGAEGLMDTTEMASNIKATFGSLQADLTSAGGSAAGSFTQINNFNQTMRSPDEVARALRVEAKYGLMKGYA